jgi:hypothetical protein
MIHYISDIILGTLIALPLILSFLSIIIGLVYYLLYPTYPNKAYKLAAFLLSISLTALFAIIILLSPVLLISYILFANPQFSMIDYFVHH